MTLQELRERQRWTLEQKIDHSLGTIEAFVNRMGGIDRVYVSFSGGKDSTVLFHLARRLYPNILGVFCNTGNEYPDIIRFVRQMQSDGANYSPENDTERGMGEVWIPVGWERNVKLYFCCKV